MSLPLDWRAALGRDGYGKVNKFGFSTGIAVAERTVWGDPSVYDPPSTAGVMKVSSASTADQAGSSGAVTITVEGLDANYEALAETVAIFGPSSSGVAVTSSKFLRTNRAYVATGGVNVGAVYVGTGAITAGKPANVYAVLPPGEAQTLQAVYTVPAGQTLLMTNLKFSTSASAKVVTARLVARAQGAGAWRVQEKFNLPAGAVNLLFTVPKTFSEKTDLQVRAATSVGTESASASFDGALVPDIGA